MTEPYGPSRAADSSTAANGQVAGGNGAAGGTSFNGARSSERTAERTPFPQWRERLRRGRALARAPGRPRRGHELAEGERRDAVLRGDALYRRSLAAADVVAAGIAIGIMALLAKQALSPLALLAAAPIVLLCSKVLGLYDRDEVVLRKTTLDEWPTLFHLATLFTLVAFVVSGAFLSAEMTRREVLVLWLASFLLMASGRVLARAATRLWAPAENCLVVGDAAMYRRIARKLAESSAVKASLVGRVYTGSEDDDARDSPLGTIEDLRTVVSEHCIDRVILAGDRGESDGLMDVVRMLKAMGVKVSLVPRLFEVVGSSIEFDDLGGVPMLGVRRFRLSRSSLILKRGLDLIGATLGLVVLSPVLALIAAAIKLDSAGPVFFRQLRVGRDGRAFHMLKFRTMVADAESQREKLERFNETVGLFKIADDPRITRVGRLLRRASLDELPQLFNVLRGQMSLVGPRPLVLDEDRRVEGWHRRRLHLPPGMTGHWQILGSARIPLAEMVNIDYLYVANWSLWTDGKILLRTIPYVLKRRGM